jgi:PPOX class probable F420-dependent enzyme
MRARDVLTGRRLTPGTVFAEGGVMLTDAVRELLDLPQTFTHLCTLQPDGAPQATVIWHRREGDTLRIVTAAAALKVRNIQRDPRVSATVAHPENAYHFVQLRGRAELLLDGPAAVAEMRLIARRYIGERADAWVDTLGAWDAAIITVYPERVSLFAEQEPG